MIVSDEFKDSEELDGLFSGFNPEEKEYDSAKGKWCYKNSIADLKPPEDGGGSSGGQHGQKRKLVRSRVEPHLLSAFGHLPEGPVGR